MRNRNIRKAIQVGLCCAVAMSVVATRALASEWPNRAITLIIPFGAGSATDLVGRLIAAPMADALGEPVVVQDVGGAAGLIGVSKAAKADPDGYTVVMGGVDTFAQVKWLRKNPPYDPVKDFEPVGLAVIQPLLLTTRKELPVSNLKEFAAYLHANQSKMQYASSGVGSAPHLACSRLLTAMGAKVTHVSYRGSAQAMQDVLAGNIDFYCPIASSSVSLMKSKSLKAMAILTEQRSPILPDLPTAKEQGFDIGENVYWMAFFVPKGTPADIVTKLNLALNKALDTPNVQMRLRDMAGTVVGPARRSPKYLSSFLASETKSWGVTIKAAGVQPN